jgi:hypothetical protein
MSRSRSTSGWPAAVAITPYQWGNANYENPSLFEGSGRDTWTEPAGITNPVVKPAGGYFSDPDILWLGPTRARLYYRHVMTATRCW